MWGAIAGGIGAVGGIIGAYGTLQGARAQKEAGEMAAAIAEESAKYMESNFNLFEKPLKYLEYQQTAADLSLSIDAMSQKNGSLFTTVFTGRLAQLQKLEMAQREKEITQQATLTRLGGQLQYQQATAQARAARIQAAGQLINSLGQGANAINSFRR